MNPSPPTGTPDPGPAARLLDLQSEEVTPRIVFCRLVDGLDGKPESLRDLARSWGLPKQAFFEWICGAHGDLLKTAYAVRNNPRWKEFLYRHGWPDLPRPLLPDRRWRDATIGGRAIRYACGVDDYGPYLSIRPARDEVVHRQQLEGAI